MLSFLTSKTTWAVLLAILASGGSINGVIDALRGNDVGLPWGPERDAEMLMLLTSIVGPLVSRQLKKVLVWLRNKVKGVDGAFVARVCIVVGLFILPMLSTSCITVRTIREDGTEVITRRLDTEAIVVCWQLFETGAPMLIDVAKQIQALREEPETPSRDERLSAVLAEARTLLEIYYANQSPAVLPEPSLHIRGEDVWAPDSWTPAIGNFPVLTVE